MKREIARRSVFGLAPAFLFPAMGSAAEIPNETKDAAQGKVTKQPFGDICIYWEGSTDQIESMTAGSLRLKAGMSPHAPHTHPEEEFMVIAEGTGDITVEGKVTKVGPGTMMYCAAGKSHGILNTGKTPLLFYFYKWKV